MVSNAIASQFSDDIGLHLLTGKGSCSWECSYILFVASVNAVKTKFFL